MVVEKLLMNNLVKIVRNYSGTAQKITKIPNLSRVNMNSKQKYCVFGNVLQFRMAHTDIEVPNWDKYRRKGAKDPEVPTSCSEVKSKVFQYMLSGSAITVALYGLKAEALRYIMFMAASEEVLAMAKIEVKLAEIPEGKNVTFKWRGKPLFIKHRTQEDIKREQATQLSELRDPETDEQRCPKPEWLVVIGVCTHLGCIPIPDMGDYTGGYYCPCHGSHYDGAGRIRKGPAPTNLEIPVHVFNDDGILVVG
ncbi:unnamed protein product [Brassicogethes aeneus]|uniref:Cytochrome b-c1 complex subunit Rieske, mitochondrial n=1 Tax=Brassicogethes aeneus TaxID=1431903 RepID=A0A9P0ATN4_BRAAE|nr:unnamed protein product [Brassicogethes aeneus]